VVYVYRWRLVQAHIIAEDVSRHTKLGTRLRRIVRLAKAYDVRMAEALQKSDIREAFSELYSVSSDIYRVVETLRQMKPGTMAGAMIYVSTAAMVAAARRETSPSQADSIADLAVDALVRVAGSARLAINPKPGARIRPHRPPAIWRWRFTPFPASSIRWTGLTRAHSTTWSKSPN
jgi:hypothetical protein